MGRYVCWKNQWVGTIGLLDMATGQRVCWTKQRVGRFAGRTTVGRFAGQTSGSVGLRDKTEDC